MNHRFLLCILSSAVLIACSQKDTTKTLVVKNPLNLDRTHETIELSKSFLGFGEADKLEEYGIKDMDTDQEITTQAIDEDGDGTTDILLFQSDIKKLSEKKYELVRTGPTSVNDTVTTCYSRFVPERTDDYAWENNRVAFRTFGPTAQKMKEDNIPGGTLTSGIDAWLKKVEYPIINKWYKKTVYGKGNYHEDTGEGLDNFHVGTSRGVGGVSVRSDSTYYFSKNFVSWKTITNGPIRTSFVLKYADWDANGNKIEEVKRISLDLGSNLSRFEISVSGTDTLSAGLTLHENDGRVTANMDEAWLSYWQPHDGSELGTGIVVPTNTMIGYENYISPKKDLSNLYAHIKTTNNKALYYAGFGWKESGQYETKEAWENYLSGFAQKINNPLIVELR